MSRSRQNLHGCQIVEELSSNDGFVSYRVTSPEYGACRLLLAHPHARLAVKGDAAFFERADMLAKLELPGMVKILDAGFYQERVACLLPLCEGEPLYEYAATPTTVGKVLGLLHTIVESLAVAHAHGVCHGNLTPPLILINEEAQPLLCDFALSQLFVLDYNSGVDPRYCSPEQVRGEVATPASDIYNLGCIFYRLLSGSPPYTGKNNFSIATRHLEGDFPVLPDPFLKCSDLLAAMVRLIPSQRSTIEEVLRGFARLLGDEELCAVQCYAPDSISEAGFVAKDLVADISQEIVPLSSISSKVEALLREQQFSLADPEGEAAVPEVDKISSDSFDTPVPEKAQAGGGELRRYFILLLSGIIIGMSMFLGYSYYQDSLIVSDSLVVEPAYKSTLLDESLKAWEDRDLDGAEKGLKQLISSHPEDPRAYNNLAAVYAARGELDKARKFLDKGLATNPDYATIHQNLAAVYTEMARESYGKALQLESTDKRLPIQVFSSKGLLLLQRRDDQALGKTGGVIAAVPAGDDNKPAVVDSPAVSPSPVTETSIPAVTKPPNTSAADSSVKPVVPESQAGAPDSAITAMLPPVSDSYQVQEFLENWAASWSAHNVDRYLSFYDAAFEPSGGIARNEWETQRRRRLQAPGDIEIGLSDFQIRKDGDLYIVEVMQSYSSQRYSDVTRKQFTLVNNGAELKIIRENALEIMR